MTSMVEYFKNSMAEINIFNNKKKAKEPQHYIMNIYNIDNDDDHFHVEGEYFFKMSVVYLDITTKLKEFLELKTVGKQEYELRLNSQQIERIFLKNLEESPDLKTVYEKQGMEDLSLKDAIQPILNYLENPLEDEE